MKSKRGASPAVPLITKNGAQAKELAKVGVHVGPPISRMAALEGTPDQSGSAMKQLVDVLTRGLLHVCVPDKSAMV
jgi:hypothetical protein